MKLSSIRVFALAVVTLFSTSLALAQYNSFNQRDDKYRLLGLKRAKEYYEVTKRDYERQESMFQKGLISQSDLDRAKNAEADAEVNYQQSLLAVLFEQQYVSIERAVKYQAANSAKRVKLTVANASSGGEEFQKLIGIDDKLFRSLQPDVIQNLYISLYNADGAIISQPYEVKIEMLKSGEPRDVDFGLLQDVDAVTVNIIYGNGSSRTLKIFLQKDNSANNVAVQSQQFSQEGELGKTATYDLTLELFSGTSNTFSLEVVNLPQQINRYFRDVATSARLSQIKFTEQANSKKAALDVSLPDRPTDQVTMDKAIPFFVVVAPTNRLDEIRALQAKPCTEADIKKLNLGYVRLELIPRGKGRLLVRAPQLYYALKSDGSVQLSVDIVNEGTRRLDNVKVDVDVPLSWTKKVDPLVIPTLDIDQEQRVTITATPPKGISVGRYELRLRTSGLSDNEPVNAEDKTVTAEILPETSVIGTILLVLAILGLIGGMVMFGIRLSKR
ncbi:MAG TPA: NEW3 domain-containing protein [Bacteroidota bacterium]|nr:NEW3 domain-containing protein [Bacteroidota bacterium]